jgi:hypothetical protein
MKRALILFLELAVIVTPGMLRAQMGDSPVPSSSSDAGPATFGSGEEERLRYSGESPATKFVVFSLGAEAAYDDNVFGNNIDRHNSTLYSVSPRLGFGVEGGPGSFILNYSPDFTDYQQIEGRDQLNHSLQLDATGKMSPHLQLRVRNSTSYRNGFFQPKLGQEFVSDLGSPTGLNESVAVPLSRILTTNSRLDLVMPKSYRTTITIFGGYQLRDFLRTETISTNLVDLRGWNTGMEYSYRLSARTSISLTYLLRNQRFGERSRLIAHSGFVSIATQVAPTVSLQLFAGPQQTRLHDEFTLTLPLDGGEVMIRASVFRVNWHIAAGGTLAKQSKNTVFKISAQRIESDGGGLFTATVSNVAGLEVGRKLGRHWDARWTARYALTEALGSDYLDSEIRSQSAGFALSRSIARRLTLRWGYAYVRQRVHGQAPIRINGDRNRASFGLYYQFGKIPLGR